MRIRTTGWLFAVCAALALVVATTSMARVQKKHVVVVSGRGFQLLAWDGSSKMLCVLVKAKPGKQNSSVCAQKLNPATGLSFTSLQNKAQTFALVGGASRKNIAKVVASFSDGSQMTIRTKAGRAYRGRNHGRVRFWAARHKGSAFLRTIAAKTSNGASMQTITVAPPPEPKPPSGCPPCGGPPRATSRGAPLIVCPLALCPE